MERTKMPFWQLGNGKMAKDFQEVFERAQVQATSRSVLCKAQLTIEIYPPDPNDPIYGNFRYKIDYKEPAISSRPSQTILHDGMIVANPQQMAPQLDLGFKEKPKNPAIDAEYTEGN